jgi:AmiR/NasT family two-component response regulator
MRAMADDTAKIEALEAAALVSDARITELVAEVEGLLAAMEHRSVIEQAKGVLMHSMQIGPDAAFAVLVAASQRENVKLRDVAIRIAAAQGTASGD